MKEPPFQLTYRPMAESDLDAVLEISKASFHSSWSRDLFLRELTHDWSTVLLAEQEDSTGHSRTVGFLVFWRVQDELHILNVATHPDTRRRGVAKRLLGRVLQEARADGRRLATLEVRKSNLSAQALYRSFGFQQVGVRPNYYVEEGEDAVVMVLQL